MINYSEFMAATIGRDMYTLSEKLSAAFNAFDGDGNGYITMDELMKLLAGQEKFDVDKESWMKMMEEADKDGDGKIDI